MPANITDVDEFTDPVQVPIDNEAADQAAFALAPQDLANRTRNLKNRLDANDVLIAESRSYARYTVSGSALTNGSLFTLSNEVDPDGNYTLATNEVQVPEAGTYLVSVWMQVVDSDTTNPSEFGFDVEVGGSPVLESRAVRFSTVAGRPMWISGTTTVDIATPSSQKIRLKAQPETDMTVDLGGATPKLNIVRIR